MVHAKHRTLPRSTPQRAGFGYHPTPQRVQVKKQDVQSQIPPWLTWVKASLWFVADGVAVAHQTDGQRGDDLQVGGGRVVAVRHLPQNVQQLLRLEGTLGNNMEHSPYRRSDIRHVSLYLQSHILLLTQFTVLCLKVDSVYSSTFYSRLFTIPHFTVDSIYSPAFYSQLSLQSHIWDLVVGGNCKVFTIQPLSEWDNGHQYLVLTKKKWFHSKAGWAIRWNVTIKPRGLNPESTIYNTFPITASKLGPTCATEKWLYSSGWPSDNVDTI